MCHEQPSERGVEVQRISNVLLGARMKRIRHPASLALRRFTASCPGISATEPDSNAASLRSASSFQASSASGSVSRLAMSRSRRCERSAGSSFRISASKTSRLVLMIISDPMRSEPTACHRLYRAFDPPVMMPSVIVQRRPKAIRCKRPANSCRRCSRSGQLGIFQRCGSSSSMFRALCVDHRRPRISQPQRVSNLLFGESRSLHRLPFQPLRADREATLTPVLNCPGFRGRRQLQVALLVRSGLRPPPTSNATTDPGGSDLNRR